MNKDLQIAKQTIQTEIRALNALKASFGRSTQFSKALNQIFYTIKIIVTNDDWNEWHRATGVQL